MHLCLPSLRWFSIQVALVVVTLLVHSVVPSAARADGFTAGSPMAAARSYHSVALLGNGKVLVTGGYGNGYLQTTELYDPDLNTFTPAASLSVSRHYHTATPLPNGKILIAGGSIDGTDYFATTELYDPASNSFTAGGTMSTARNAHTATLLKNGKVLVTGGHNGLHALSGAEIYDPATDVFAPTATAMTMARHSHTATMLADGKVLIVGGLAGANAVAQAEIYDPATNSFSPASSLATGRYYHTATLLPGGKVLVAGGSSDAAILQSAELYDPQTGSFAPASQLASRRYSHSSTLLPNGKVLISGGRNGSIYMNTVELYDPATGTFSAAPNMLSGRYLHASILLPNGKVLVTGGSNLTGSLRLTELYDSTASSFSSTGDLAASRSSHAAVALPNGRIMLAGGNSGNNPVATVEIFQPSLSTSLPISSMATPRRDFTATVLPNGKVLITGGNNGSGSTAEAELYDPAAEAFTTLPPLGTPREKHTATLMKDGKVLIAGGLNGAAPLASTELFDPASNAFAAGPPMAAARHSHSATALRSGKVLITGGANTGALGTAELFDPATRAFQSTFTLTAPREGHTATLLPSGKVLVTGGKNGSTYLGSAEIFDPASGFSATGAMTAQRHNHRALLLSDGRVLVTGGRNGSGTLNSTELFDPALNSFSSSAAMGRSRESHAALLLPDGSVFVAGGSDGVTLAAAEIFTHIPATAAARRPDISTSSAPEGASSRLNLSGTRFAGYLESSSGSANSAPVNHPLLQLQGLDSGASTFVLTDPAVGWTDTSFASASFYGLPTGFYRARLITAAVPSVEKMVRIAPSANVEPPSLDFSGVSISRTSPSLSVSTINAGSADLYLAGASIIGTDAAMFSLDAGTGCSSNGVLAQNETCNLQVAFHPSSTGDKEAVVRIATSDPDRPVVDIPLAGTGIIVTYPLTIISAGTGSGRIDLSTGGSCTGNCSESVIDGTTVGLSAVAGNDAVFAGWNGCDTASGTTCTVTMTDARTVTASFSGTVPLTVRFPGSGSGTVTFSTGEVCNGTCSKQVLGSTTVILTAAATSPSYFTGWSGCDSVEGTSCTVSATAAREVEVFFRSTYALGVTVTGTGTGTVTMPSAAICTGTCSETFAEGTSVSLTATPAAGSHLGSWLGCDSVSGTTCTVTMSSLRNVTATFSVTPLLTIDLSGTGSGTVTMSPGETCTSDCSKAYTTGTQVTLTPAAAAGSLFSGWSGCDYTSGTTCYVTMTYSRNVNATFTAGFPLSVGVTGSGTVNLDPGGTCAISCTNQYTTGSTVTLTPAPVGSATFLGWTGCDSVSGTTCTVTMTSVKNVTAAFTSSYQLYLTVTGNGSGRFDFSTGDSCTGSCFKTFTSGSTISIIPQPSPGVVVNGWTGCDQVVNDTCTVTLSGARNVTATLGLAISIGSRLYANMQEAYNALVAGEQARIQTYDFVGDVTCNRAVPVRISGGYDKTFTSMTGLSSMKGTLTVARGSVEVENLVIK